MFEVMLEPLRCQGAAAVAQHGAGDTMVMLTGTAQATTTGAIALTTVTTTGTAGADTATTATGINL